MRIALRLIAASTTDSASVADSLFISVDTTGSYALDSWATTPPVRTPMPPPSARTVVALSALLVVLALVVVALWNAIRDRFTDAELREMARKESHE